MMPSLSVIARRLDFIRETAPNDGAWVNAMQRFTGNHVGDAWCASFVSFVLDVAYRGKSPILRTASTQAMLLSARDHGYEVLTPAVDDLYFFIANARAHHVGIVTGLNPLTGIAGNTSEDGHSSNGTGVFEHTIKADAFVRLPK